MSADHKRNCHRENNKPLFLISNFRRDLNIVYVLLGISPASNCSWPTFRIPVSVPSSKAERYAKMLQDFFVPRLQGLPVNKTTYFQQDGTTSHTAKISMNILRPLFPGHLISRYGDIAWPAKALKMELTQGSETSANYNLTPGKYPKEHIQNPFLFTNIKEHKTAILVSISSHTASHRPSHFACN